MKDDGFLALLLLFGGVALIAVLMQKNQQAQTYTAPGPGQSYYNSDQAMRQQPMMRPVYQNSEVYEWVDYRGRQRSLSIRRNVESA